MTDLTTDDLKRLASEATPGPWEPLYGECYRVRADGMNIATMHFVTLLDRLPEKQVHANASLIALTPALAAEVLTLRAQAAKDKARIERLEAALRFYTGTHEPGLSNPSEGPWGVNSTDFGKVARAALEGVTPEARP